MKINIYGVGRSGTKALQLYLTYILCQQNQQVWVNYEPFKYANRQLTISNLGQQIHYSNPLFIDNYQSMSGNLTYFCQDLAAHQYVVTKFIRANGRINAINQVMQPDLSILVIRDLYQVLASSAIANWCLVESKSEWERFVAEAKERYPIIKQVGQLGRLFYADKLLITAVYWFVMNMSALDNLGKTIVIKYADLKQNSLGKLSNLITHRNLPLTNSMFQGRNIHTNYPLQDLGDSKQMLTQTSLAKVAHKIGGLTNKVASKTGLAESQLSLSRLLSPAIGSLCEISTGDQLNTTQNSASKIRSSVEIKQNEFLHQLVSQVETRLAHLSHQKV
ncbi:MAG: hypothetical protein AAF298_01785 [Cyanobacteria bacterium P01_A01_bin.40]